jgi:hypothetical protein
MDVHCLITLVDHTLSTTTTHIYPHCCSGVVWWCAHQIFSVGVVHQGGQTVSCPPWGVKVPHVKCPMASLATEDGVHTMTALRLHGTPTAIQPQFKRNSKCGCGGICVVHQAVNWHPWCVGHWILVPHGVPGHRRWRAHYDRTTTARHPNRSSNAVQTQFKVRLWRDVCGPPSSELASLVCGPLDPSAPWGPWPHRTTTARHPNRYSNAIQTVELQIQCRGNAILCVVVVCVWLVCGQPRWEYSVLLPPVPCEDDVNTLPCTPPFPNRGSNGRRLS